MKAMALLLALYAGFPLIELEQKPRQGAKPAFMGTTRHLSPPGGSHFL